MRFEPGAAQKRALDSVGATLVERMPLGGLVRARLEPGASLAAADRALERRSDVVAAGPNKTYELYATPTDTLYPELWGLDAIGAPLAWDVTQGSNAVVVAVVDTGADVTHPDLDANIWTNPGEIANGLDDDANGLVDDLKGWDFAGDDSNVHDTTGHGTHVAGTIGAEGDNAAGVSGVNWRVKVMPLRTGNSTLSGLAIEQAFRYACAEGARVVNGSFGSPSPDPFVRDAIEDCPGTLFVFAAGNESAKQRRAAPLPLQLPRREHRLRCGEHGGRHAGVLFQLRDDERRPRRARRRHPQHDPRRRLRVRSTARPWPHRTWRAPPRSCSPTGRRSPRSSSRTRCS